MEPGYICGHEGTGVIHESGSDIKNFAKGDRVIVPFLVSGFNGAKRAVIDTPKEQWKDMTIAVIGGGPVAMCSIISAREYKPARIFAIDSIPSRLQATKKLGCIPINFKELDPVLEIKKATDNNGVHAVIEGVGLTPALKTAYDIICPGGKIRSFVNFIDLVLPGLDESFEDALKRFERGELNKVIFKPNGPDA
ncbi:Fc.00g041760.m01.CDS01 [Cosmosporella sp. VM-42]